MALSGATIPGQSGPGSNGNEEVLHIHQRSSIIVHSLDVKTGLFRAIQLSISTQFKCQNSSILNNSV